MDSTNRHHFAAEVAALLQAGRVQAGLGLLSFRLQSHPDEAEWRFVMAIVQRQAGKLGEAAGTLAMLRETRPDDPAVQALDGRLHQSAEQLARRRAAARALMDEAEEAVEEGEVGSALARARAAVAMAPELVEPHALLAQLLVDAEPHAAQRHGDYAVCLEALADEDEPESPAETPGRWSTAWRLAMAEWPAWLLLDSVACLVISLPLCIVVAYPSAVWLGANTGGLALVREMLAETAGSIVLAGLAATLWMWFTGGCYGTQRLVVMAGKLGLGGLAGGLLGVGLKRFGRRWAGIVGALGLVALLSVLLCGSVVLLPLAIVGLPAFLFVVPLIVLRGERTGRAMQQSYQAIKPDWLAWAASVCGLTLAVTVLGALSLLCPAWGIVAAFRTESVVLMLTWLVLGLLGHSIFFPLAWGLSHVASFAGLLAYRDVFGEAGFRAVPLALYAPDEDDDEHEPEAESEPDVADESGPADIRPAGDELGDPVGVDADDREDAGT